MSDVDTLANVCTMLEDLPFVITFGISVLDCTPGAVTVQMPYDAQFSTPPHHYPASIIGMIGDVAAVSSCVSCLPDGWAAATLDYTVKMTGPATGAALIARGRVLQNGRTTSVAAAEVYTVSEGREVFCGSVLATSRNFEIKK